jgi:hypothetical protein
MTAASTVLSFPEVEITTGGESYDEDNHNDRKKD